MIKMCSSFCDGADNWQVGMQDPVTPAAEAMHSFHNYLLVYLLFIGVVVFWMLYKIFVEFHENKNQKVGKFTHASILEIGWTVTPAITLVLLGIPSFGLLYSLDAIADALLTVKIFGNQWFWGYEYEHLDNSVEVFKTNIYFDSYMIPIQDLPVGGLRLLEVDNKMILPINSQIRTLITGCDVLHSWSVPSFGSKIDATPGRLSQSFLYLKRAGTYYGQCSEICGINHGFMPIVSKVVSLSEFSLFLDNISAASAPMVQKDSRLGAVGAGSEESYLLNLFKNRYVQLGIAVVVFLIFGYIFYPKTDDDDDDTSDKKGGNSNNHNSDILNNKNETGKTDIVDESKSVDSDVSSVMSSVSSVGDYPWDNLNSSKITPKGFMGPGVGDNFFVKTTIIPYPKNSEEQLDGFDKYTEWYHEQWHITEEKYDELTQSEMEKLDKYIERCFHIYQEKILSNYTPFERGVLTRRFPQGIPLEVVDRYTIYKKYESKDDIITLSDYYEIRKKKGAT